MTTTPGRNAPGADAPPVNDYIRAAIENAEGASGEGGKGGGDGVSPQPIPNFFPGRFQIFSPVQFFMDTCLKDILMEAIDDTVVASQFNGGGVDFLSSVMDNFIRVYGERFGEDESAAVLAWEKPAVQNLLAAL